MPSHTEKRCWTGREPAASSMTGRRADEGPLGWRLPMLSLDTARRFRTAIRLTALPLLGRRVPIRLLADGLLYADSDNARRGYLIHPSKSPGITRRSPTFARRSPAYAATGDDRRASDRPDARTPSPSSRRGRLHPRRLPARAPEGRVRLTAEGLSLDRIPAAFSPPPPHVSPGRNHPFPTIRSRTSTITSSPDALCVAAA